jgi:hypothetical protein
MAIKTSGSTGYNTSGLSGYALAYAKSLNSNGGDITAANKTVNTATYGNAAGPTTNAQRSQAVAGSKFSVVPGTNGLYSTGGTQKLGPTQPDQIAQPIQPLQPEQPVQQPLVQTVDPQDYINQLKDAQRQSRIAALDKAKTSALGSLDTEQANVAPTYYDKRNQAAAASDVGAMNFAQYMAARGIKGAAGAMPEIYRNAGLQGQIGALDQQEASNLAGIERQRANVNTGYASDVAGANADVESQAMQAMITQYNADRANNLAQAQITGSLGDTRTLAGQEYDYSKSSSNPDVQATILANKARELDNAAQEIQNSYLPDTLKLQAQQLQQKVNAGTLDYDTAMAQMDQIKAQTAQAQHAANAPYSSGSSGSSDGMTPAQEASSLKTMNDWVTNQVANDSRLSEDKSNYAALYDAWKTMYVANNYGGSANP